MIIKKILYVILSILFIFVVSILLLEGIFSIMRFGTIHQSATYNLYLTINREFLGRQLYRRSIPYDNVLSNTDEIESLLQLLKQQNVGLGNAPYRELKTKQASINMRSDGCLHQKPNVRKIMHHLRTSILNPWDPVSFFYDESSDLDPKLRKFIERYGLRPIHHTTNALGERLTIPKITRTTKVLVAGDSVAVGAMIDDAETITSQLQLEDVTRQFVNIGVGGAHASDIVCALENAAKRYRSIAEVIYVYCENDFEPGLPYGKPQEVIRWLRDYTARIGAKKTTIVYAPYIYNVAPNLTRLIASRGEHFPTHAKSKQVLIDLVKQAGFKFVDIGEIARDETRRRGSQFAALSLYVDHVHLSPYGVKLLVKRLRSEGQP